MKQIVTMTKAQFLAYMMQETSKPFSAIRTQTKIERFKGGKATAAKYGGHVIKEALVTFVANTEYQKAVDNACKKFGIDPAAFVAEEHPYAERYTNGGKLTSVAFHKEDAALPAELRRNYLVAHIVKGCVSTQYAYTDANGMPVDAADLHADLYDNTSKKQADVGLVGDMQVIYRNYKFESIRRVSYMGMDIELV